MDSARGMVVLWGGMASLRVFDSPCWGLWPILRCEEMLMSVLLLCVWMMNVTGRMAVTCTVLINTAFPCILHQNLAVSVHSADQSIHTVSCSYAISRTITHRWLVKMPLSVINTAAWLVYVLILNITTCRGRRWPHIREDVGGLYDLSEI